MINKNKRISITQQCCEEDWMSYIQFVKHLDQPLGGKH